MSPEPGGDPLIQSATVLRPGDRVLVQMNRDISQADAADVRDKLIERFPDVEFTVLGADQIFVERADA